MKKLFLTSGVILCMACPAMATPTDIPANGSAQCTYTYLDDYTGPVSFEAKWNAVNYTISFAKGQAGSHTDASYITGSTNSVSPVTFDDTSITLTSNGFSARGYHFDHWSSNVNLETGVSSQTDYNDGATLETYQYAGSPTLTAQWAANTYTVSYAAGAHGSGSSTHTNGATFDANYTIKGMGSGSGQSGVTPDTGYHFVKWTGSSTDTNYSAPANGYTETQTITPYTIDGPLTLTAQFAPDTSHISYATGTAGSRTTGFSGTMADTDATYDASVTLRTNAFSIAGYDFAGWTSTVNLASGATAASTYDDGETINPYKVASNVTLTATWTPLHYSVIYNPGAHGTGGTTDSYNSVSGTGGATYDANYTALTQSAASVTANPGYTFKGWNTNTGQTTANWSGETPWTRTSTLTVYAAYTANPYTITYNCGSPKSGSNSAPAAQTPTVAAAYTSFNMDGAYTLAPASTCSMNGYTFKGWSCPNLPEPTSNNHTVSYTDYSGTSASAWAPEATGTYSYAGNITCTAMWQQNNITLTWYPDTVANGGTTPMSASAVGSSAGSCNYDGTLNLPTTNPSKNGYTFNGWHVRSTGN